MKVSVKDFQIVKSASLEFVPGLTVIQGESNNGKSALFRAIKSCIYNEPGTTNVRVGCKNFMVGIEYNGHTVIQQKGENSLYVIDGQQYNKVGKTQVPEVAKVLGINALTINDSIEKINFWDQMEKPFLLDRNSSDLFRFVVDSGEDDNLNSTLRSMVSDKNKLNTEKSLKEGEINTLKGQIDSMNNLLADSEEKIQLCENIISLGPKNAKLNNINNIITNITTERKEKEEVEEEIKSKKILQKELDDRLREISYKISVQEQLKDKLTVVNGLNKTLNDYTTKLSSKVAFAPLLDNLQQKINTKDMVAGIITKAQPLQKLVQQPINKIIVNIDNSKVDRYRTLSEVIHRVKVLKDIINNVTAVRKQLDNSVKPYLDEYMSFDTCPYCGNKLKEGGCN